MEIILTTAHVEMQVRVLALARAMLHARAMGASIFPLLIGAFGGGHSAGHAPHGWFLGVDAGRSWLIGGTDVAARSASSAPTSAWCLGARAGYQLRSGIAMQVRYDQLGVTAPDASGNVSLVSAGVRYSFPAEIEPFAEAMVGPAFDGTNTSPAAALGIGVSVLATRHVAFDLAARDSLVDDKGVHHVPAITLGITAGFGG